jgi:hypothetical protein
MKKFLLFMAMVFVALVINAQDHPAKCTPLNSSDQTIVIQERVNAIDFTTTFTDGSSGSLFTVLDAGNSVVLDFFYTT